MGQVEGANQWEGVNQWEGAGQWDGADQWDGAGQWGDEAAVLPFGRVGRDERRYEDLLADDSFDDDDDGFGRGCGRDLGQLTMVVMMDDKVVAPFADPSREVATSAPPSSSDVARLDLRHRPR